MTTIEPIALQTELSAVDASSEIAKAVSARHSIARKYVMWVRRRHPDATPAEVIQIIERHYGTSISAAGAAIAVGAIAADVGISFIPVAGSAAAGIKSAGQQAAKKTAQQAAKQVALGVGKVGAQRGIALLPAGDAQLQFEITAIFALAIADIHGKNLDKEQAHALVFGLSNGRVSQQQIATMATDLANVSSEGVVGTGRRIAAGREDWSHWASTLADTLPGGAAQSLVRTIQTGQLDTVRMNLSGKQQSAIEYGVGALSGGVTRFVFGRDGINAARVAFPDAPDAFPPSLAKIEKLKSRSEDGEAGQNRALAALQDAAKATGNWVTDTAGTVGGGVAAGAFVVGTGVASAAGTVARSFQSVDIDGDGIPDEPRALSTAKSIGGAVAGAAGSAGKRVTGFFKPKKRGQSWGPKSPAPPTK